MQITDQFGQTLHFKNPPKRIISLVPSQTELLVDMGLKDQIVGVTKFCVHPENIRKEKMIVGGTKGIRLNRIQELEPDIILCNKEENTKEMVEELAQLYPVHISDINNLEETYELISQYGQIFDKPQEAQKINANIQAQVADFNRFVTDKPILKVAYFIWRKPWMVVGSHTFVNYLLNLNKFENVYEEEPRYPEIDIHQLKEMDFLLLSSEPFPFAEKHRQELLPMVKKETQIKFVDGEYFSWYGSRLAAAFQYFKSLRETELTS